MSKEFNQIIVHPDFEGTLKDLAKKVPKLPNPVLATYDFDEHLNSARTKLEVIGKIGTTKLNPDVGRDFFEKNTLYGYDESFVNFQALKGTAFLTSHSLILVGEKYLPVNYITLYFYTRSKLIKGDSNIIRYSENPELDNKINYYADRINLMEKFVKDNSILLIDGPLIAGDAFVRFIPYISAMNKKNICTAFFVKNSGGNIITDNIPEFKGVYNHDLHWANEFLLTGERTNFFKYTDDYQKENSRVFCFVKAFNASPQRVEFHTSTYEKFLPNMDKFLDMIYYLLLVQGNVYNPQIRPIAIAEKYARETLHLFDVQSLLKKSGIVPTMNQVRFG